MFENIDTKMEIMASIFEITTYVQPTIIAIGFVITRGLHLH
jgi:hypothetical protein